MMIAMIGHKAIPSTRGGIETVLTNLCPLIVSDGNDVVCYNRTSDKIEPEFEGEVKGGTYKGVKLKRAPTLKVKGIAALLASFTAAVRAAFGKYDIVHFHAEGPSAAIIIPQLFGKKSDPRDHGLESGREMGQRRFAPR